MTKKRTIFALAVAVFALAATGCGGDDEATSGTDVTPAGEWADGFCTAISTWTTSVTDIQDQFTDLSDFSESSLQEAADDLESSTTQLVDDLKALGTPDTESGEEIKEAIDELGTTVETEIDEIQATADETSGITELPGAVQDMLGSLEVISAAFTTAFSTFEDADVQGELEAAFEASPDCESIGG